MSQLVQTDLVIIGGGPGGYTAAFYAADHGLKVTLVEKHLNLGGVCLNVGCIPSKTLLHVASVKEKACKAKDFGIIFNEPKIDLDKMRAYKNSIINKMSKGLNQLSKMRKVNVIPGVARFLSSTELEVVADKNKKTKISFKNAIIATGSKPIMPKHLVIDQDKVMDSTRALELVDIPKRLLIVGGGVIGLELGSCYAALGSKIIVVEALNDIITGADKDLVSILKKKLAKEFEAIHTNTLVERIVKKKEALSVTYKGKKGKDGSHHESILVDKVLLSIGRRPNSNEIGLENTQVQVDDKSFIQVDNSNENQ